MNIYLDYAAATPLDPDVLAAMQPFFNDLFHNPSALYGPAVQVSKALAAARADIAEVLGVKSSEIIFTAGGTEANNLAIHGIMQKYPEAQIAVSAIEHDSVRIPASGYDFIVLPVDEDGFIKVNDIGRLVSDQTVLVSVMYANNEIGTVQPLRRIALELQKIRSERKKNGNKMPLYFHTDAAQAGNYLDLHVNRLGVDLMVINGGKLYGPKQSGALYVKSGLNPKSLIQGGGQERNLRSGTENVAGAVGLSAALVKAARMRNQESERLQALQAEFKTKLQSAIPQISFNGSRKYRLPNNLHVTFPDQDNERLLIALDMEGIQAGAGSACSASHDEPSHVLGAIGLTESAIRSSLRFSMGRHTTSEQIDTFIGVMKAILNR